MDLYGYEPFDQIASYLYPSREGSRALEQGGSRSLGRCSSGSWRSRHRGVNSKVARVNPAAVSSTQ
jgi:hypothetical protein